MLMFSEVTNTKYFFKIIEKILRMISYIYEIIYKEY